MKYSLGLDIGVTSIGWAVIDEENKHIERLGVRLFDEAENPKDGSSLAEPRRLARSARRRLRRRRGRLDALIDLFITAKLLTTKDIESMWPQSINPVFLRAKGLDEKLSPKELFLALFHIAKRRGYKSNRKKIEASDKELGVLLSGASANHERLKQYRTVGEMLAKDEFFGAGSQTRNKNAEDAKEGYKHTILREDLYAEVVTLLAAQRTHGNAIPKDFETRVIDIIFFQRPFAADGDIEAKVGRCEFIPAERRAAKASYTYELSRLYQNLNNLTFTGEGRIIPKLTEDERAAIVQYAHEHSTAVSYTKIRKIINLPDTARFAGLLYQKDKNPETAGGTKFGLPGYHKIKKCLEEAGVWVEVAGATEKIDQIAEILTLCKTDEDVQKHLADVGLPDTAIVALAGVSFSGFGNLSLVALRRLQPHLAKGFSYIESCDVEGFRPGKLATRGLFLKGLDKHDNTLTNPVMKRAVSQVIKVVNAVVREYGSPYFVKIECAHDLSRDHLERMKIHKRQEENRVANEQLKTQLVELGLSDPKGFDLLKLRLYREQGGKCAYTLQSLDERRVFSDPNYTEVDHIIPYSRCGDDRNLNKVLVLSGANRDKLNRTPYEWFGADMDRWRTFGAFVSGCATMHPRKREFLLIEKYAQGTEWASRALNDTRYITRFLSGYIDDGLEFAPGKEKRRVIISSGTMTAYLRRWWRIEKDREASDLHHAADAAVIATIDHGLIQKVALYSKANTIRPYLAAHAAVKNIDELDPEAVAHAHEMMNRIAKHEARASDFFPKPWDGFDDELREKVKGVFVSYAPKRTVSGEARGANPVRRNTKKHGKAGFFINGGKDFVENGDIVCVDIFSREEGGKKQYFIVPIYVHQTRQKALPTQILPVHKKFTNIDGSFEFCFRLFPRDLVKLTFKKDEGAEFLYFRKFNRNQGAFEFDRQNGEPLQKNIGTLPLIEKFTVDPLGKISKVSKETRLDFSRKKR